MDKKIILGLDISTKCIGVSCCYVDEESKITPIIVTHMRPKIPTKITGIEALFLKCNLFMEALENMLISNNLYDKETKKTILTNIVIEEALLSSNNEYTVGTLLKYNGMVALEVYKLTGIIPEFISSYDARKFGVPSLMAVRKFKKNGEEYPEAKIKKAINDNELVLFGAYPFDCAKKLILWNYISELYPNINWVYNTKNELKDENFDASDSLICVMGYVNKCKYGETEPEVVCVDTAVDGENITYNYSYKFCDQTFSKSVTVKQRKLLKKDDAKTTARKLPKK